MIAAAPAAACPGDCDGNGTVVINELIRAVSIALGQSSVDTCTAIDTDGMGDASIGELIAAVNALVAGCLDGATPTPTETGNSIPTPTDTGPPSTPTATVNQPPVLPTASIYRTFPDFQITLPLNASDPEGGSIACSVEDLPTGASFDEESAVLSWLPTDQQLGVFYVPYACSDDASPPQSASGRLAFRISALDDCTIPTCDPAAGCTTELVPPDQPCCGAGPAARIAEPAADCPEGLVAYVGQNSEGFGRIQNCDLMHVRNFEQSGAELQFNVEGRCVNSFNRIRLRSRMDSSAANHPIIFDTIAPSFLYAQEADGFARRRGYRFPVSGGGPFFDIEGAEANLTISLTDQDGVSVTERVRVRLSFTPHPDLPDVDPTPLPTATRTPSP